jgi:cyclase
MLKTRVMPCLLLLDGGLVKTVKFRKPDYVGDPVNAIKIYNEKEVDELIFLDITATVQDRSPPFDVISRICDECFMPLCYGGGVRRIDDIRRIFKLGVEKVALNSYVHENPLFLREAADTFGNQSIVGSIDVKRNLLGRPEVWIASGTKNTYLDPVRVAVMMQEHGAGELLVNSIDRDGTWEGYDIELLRKVTAAVEIPVIALGGAGTVDHLGRAVREGGASALAVGSMVVYSGKGMGVLIKFPSRQELESVLGKKGD